MKSCSKRLLWTAAVAVLATPFVAQADVTISNGPAFGSVGSFGVDGVDTIGEVFTAPITGTLTSFTLSLNDEVGNLSGGIADWSGPATFATGFGATALDFQSGSEPSTAAGPYTFGTSFIVTAGQQYVAYLSTFNELTDNSAYLITTDDVEPDIDYLVYNLSGSPITPVWDYSGSTRNALFSASFSPLAGSGGGCDVDLNGACLGGGPSGTPEPASWALMMMGLTAVGTALRRRNRGTPTPGE